MLRNELKNAKDGLRLYNRMNKPVESRKCLEKALAIIDENTEKKTIQKAGRRYFGFWTRALESRLFQNDLVKAKEVVNSLNAWFGHYHFQGLLPRFNELLAEFYEKSGNTEKVAHYESLSAEQIKEGLRAIAGKHFTKEVVHYMDFLVESSEDEQLTDMYGKVRCRLASGLFPEFLDGTPSLAVHP